jgi:hypothetical protein
MDWKDNCKYRIRGQYHSSGGEQMMIFDLVEPEIIMQEILIEDGTEKKAESEYKDKEETDEITEKKVKKILFPKEWLSSFGNKTNNVVFLQRVRYSGDWDVLRPAKTVEGMEIITREVLDSLSIEAEEMINRMRSAV